MREEGTITLILTADENLALARFLEAFMEQAIMDRMSREDIQHIVTLLKKLLDFSHEAERKWN